ncbi:hypothetical protein VY732_11720 [Pseudomonas sp. ZY71]|uniref:hypothetical protein n=1 Tax=Pseudomonas sp. ZY71 TaxID=3115647 RepID=UPI002F40F894
MEELIGIVPLVLATASLLVTLFNLKDRVKAEQNFVEALQTELKKEIEVKQTPSEGNVQLTDDGEKLGNHDPALVRAIFRDALRSVESPVQVQGVVYKALNDLAEKDRKYIKLTLKTNTVAGRARYLGKLFRKALGIAS